MPSSVAPARSHAADAPPASVTSINPQHQRVITKKRSMIILLPPRLFHLLELLQRTQALRDRHVGMRRRPISVADRAYVGVPPRVERDGVRCAEFSGLGAGTFPAAQPPDQRAVLVDYRNPRPDVRRHAVHFHARAQFADDKFEPRAAMAI